MRYRTLLLLLSVMALSSARLAANDIEPGKEFYNATRIPNPIVIDGDLKEWTGVPVLADPKYAIPKFAGTTGTYVLFEEYNGGTWTGPDDQTSAVQVVWDADNLYIGIVVTDDYHENSANSAWNGDSAQLMIANGTRTTQVALYNYALGGVEGALGDVIVNHEAGPAADDACNCATEAVIKRDSVKKKTIYEIKMPAAALGLTAPMTAGTKIGLGMAINDGDEFTPGQKGWGGLGAHSIVFGKTPSETAELTLSTNIPGADRIFFSAINPAPELFSFRATDKGISILDAASVKLTIDGQVVALTASPKSGDSTDFSYKPATLFASGVDHTYLIEAKDTLGNTVTSPGSFKPLYSTLPASLKVTTADSSKPGFIFNVFQNEADQTTSNARAEKEIAGDATNADGTPMPNLADPSAAGVALGAGTPTNPGSKPIRFEVATVINLSRYGTDNVGNFTDALPADAPRPDDVMPGLPGTSGVTDGVAGEIITWVDLPKGWVTLGVNSDDGFATAAGQVGDKFMEISLGVADVARGAADTIFKFYVEEAGIYRLRTIWENGGGGANIEWFMVKADGTKVLLNDTANGGYKCYRAKTGAADPVLATATQVVPAPNQSDASPNRILVQLRDGDTAIDKATVSLKVDGAAVNATITKTGKTITLDYVPTPVFAASSKHTATFAYTEGSQQITRNWQFTIGVYSKDLVRSNIGVLMGVAKFTDDKGGHSGKAGDYAMDLGAGQASQAVHIIDATFLNEAAANDEMAVAGWQKLYSVANSAFFWGVSPSSNGSQRGWGTHSPWSGGTLYFDTAGCCDGATQRINAPITDFPDYSGAETWWNSWHHLVFQKKLSTKEIWIDGKLFFTGESTAPLPTDFTEAWFGFDPPDNARLQGIIDDMAVFKTALTEANILKLVNGTSTPKDLPGIIAYWDFNDVPAPSAGSLPSEAGKTVNGFQDDFTSATRDPNWQAFGPGGDLYVQENGVLKVFANQSDPNHLLYMGAGASNSVQEVVARIRVVNFGTNDAARAGIGVGVSTNINAAKDLESRGINLHFRDNTQDSVVGRQFKLLDDNRAWGPAGLKIDWKNDTWYWLRLRQEQNANGGTIDVFGKAWADDGVTPEPATWQMTWDYIPTRTIRTGYPGITGCSIDGLGQFEVDYILIKVAGLPSITVNIPVTGPASTVPKFFLMPKATATNVTINWFGGGTLQSASDVTGTWTDKTKVSPLVVPLTGASAAGPQNFYRVKK